MKRNLFLLIFIFPLFCFAQKQGNIWYFGDHAGLDFNSVVPIPLLNGQTHSSNIDCAIEGTSVICDSSGSLLFYTNGQQIWNSNHQIMPNGDSLFGNFSSTQSSLIVPQPGSSRYFYVFTTDDFCTDNLIYGFRYSIVDICLDSGFGDVIKEKKNIKLLDTVAEKLTAVRHSNGIDYWIIIHKFFSDAFYSYHLSSSGITDTVVSYIGSRHPDSAATQSSWAAIGEMKVSPDGNNLAIVNGNSSNHAIAEYFNFNKSTGVVSNWINLLTNLDYTNNHQFYGISFSPDNTKLYISCWLNNNGIFQFNLNAGGGNADSVRASITKIAGQNWSKGIQLGPDEKIYVAGNGNQYISVINNPNGLGLNCNFQDSAIYLNGRLCSFSLPNFIDSYDYSNTVYDCGNGIEEQNQLSNISVFPNPTDGLLQIGNSKNKIENVEVFNILGEKVYEKNVNDFSARIILSVPDGVYFVKIICKEGTIVKKIVVQK